MYPRLRDASSSIRHSNHAFTEVTTSSSIVKFMRIAHARDSSNLMMPKVVDEKLASFCGLRFDDDLTFKG